GYLSVHLSPADVACEASLMPAILEPASTLRGTPREPEAREHTKTRPLRTPRRSPVYWCSPSPSMGNRSRARACLLDTSRDTATQRQMIRAIETLAPRAVVVVTRQCDTTVCTSCITRTERCYGRT